MNARADQVLDDIDGALTAWGTVRRDGRISTDAMRWLPETPTEPEPEPEPVTIQVRIEAFVEFEALLSRLFTELGRALEQAAQAWATSLDREFGKLLNDLNTVRHPYLAASDRKHRARCRVCNPAGNPPPLPPSGYDYNARRKARAKRRR